MSAKVKVLFLLAFVLLLAGSWPVIAWFNRIYPFVLGLPLFLAYMFLLNIIVAVYLLVAYRVTRE